MRKLSLLLCGLLLGALPAVADSAPHFAYGAEVGINQSWDNTLNTVLKNEGLATVADSDLWSFGWRTAFGADSWTIELASTRLSNTTWGFPTSTQRTRLVADAATLGAGGDWELVKGLHFVLTGGLTVDRLLLQTYRGDLGDASDVWGATGQGSFQSDWSFSPQASTRLSWRLWTIPNQTYGLALWVGASAGYRLGSTTWKVNGDAAVSGLGSPWTTWVRPFVGVGFQ